VEGWFDMAIFKPKPVAPKPVMGKPVMAPKPVAAKPVMAPRPVAKPVIAPKPVAAKPVIAPRLAPPTPQPVVGKKDAFYSSPEYKGFQKDSAGKPATMDMYDSPYFGSVGSGSVGRAQDAAYRKYKGIAEPTPDGGPVGTSPAPIGVGGGMAGLRGLLGGGAAPSQPVMGNNIGTTGFKQAPATFQPALSNNMKKGGAVKAKAPVKKMASGGAVSSTSKRGDGIAQRGKTKGRMV
jgi:hypothetical protein